MIAGFVILIGISLTATFSPILAIKDIQVTGTNRMDPSLVSNALKDFLDVPLPLLSEQEVSDALADFDLIESFAAISLPPNTLQIRIVEREPICIVRISGQDWLYDPAGVRVAKATAADILPEIKITEEPRNSLRFRNAIDVLLALPANLLDEIEYLEAKTKDDVEMVLRNSKNQRIIWGDSSDSVLKSKVLQALIKNNKNATSITFDVSSPNAPVVRYDNF
ncbi:MAG: FtsQ-type POTRA domain-containing protein [Actinomycetota bacterium]